MTAMAIAQSTELCDVSRKLIEVMQGIQNAAARLVRLVGDLVGPASPGPDEKEERRSHG